MVRTSQKLLAKPYLLRLLHRVFIGLIGAVALSGTVSAGQPPDSVVSDQYDNTAMGTNALFSLTPGNGPLGYFNTAAGYQALYSNTVGNYNTAFGDGALYQNTTGGHNMGSGYRALYRNTTGDYNAAFGVNALLYNKDGIENTALGSRALQGVLHGSNNIGIGYFAGAGAGGSNNIEIGNEGVEADNGVIRIGTQTAPGNQINTYIAGIYDNTSVNGLPVVIDSNGQLGTTSSSERFKAAIAPMGTNTDKLEQLRPVTFYYKADQQGTRRYGLIAEEVAEVYPELVVRDSKGRIDGVRYDELAPMLLNEVQKQQQTIAAQTAEIHNLKQQQEQFATQAELQDLKQQLQAALAALQSKEQLVARR